jgi:hypothetical protein
MVDATVFLPSLWSEAIIESEAGDLVCLLMYLVLAVASDSEPEFVTDCVISNSLLQRSSC